MSEQKKSREFKRIRIRMQLPFSDFGVTEREIFLGKLANIIGASRDDFSNIVFKSGCVIFEGDLEREAALLLIEYYQKRDAGKLPPEIEGLRELLIEYNIDELVDLQFTFRISTPSKTREEKHVVFVHGWRGDKNTFGALPTLIRKELRCKTNIYPYPTGVFTASPSIEFISRNFENWLRRTVQGNQYGMIAHSMGGLIVRRMIVSQYIRDNPLDKNLRIAIFVSSPHDGSALAELGKKVPGIQKNQLIELAANSPFLIDLNERWEHWLKKNVPQSCHVRCVYGTADNVVSTNNARSYDTEAIPILNAGHIDIVKANSGNDEIVRVLRELLIAAGLKS